MEKLGITRHEGMCPQCHSERIRIAGHHKDGRKVHACGSCGNFWPDVPASDHTSRVTDLVEFPPIPGGLQPSQIVRIYSQVYSVRPGEETVSDGGYGPSSATGNFPISYGNYSNTRPSTRFADYRDHWLLGEMGLTAVFDDGTRIMNTYRGYTHGWCKDVFLFDCGDFVRVILR